MTDPDLIFVGKRGSLEILPEGTVERECAERGERIYELADLPELLEELRQAKAVPPGTLDVNDDEAVADFVEHPDPSDPYDIPY